LAPEKAGTFWRKGKAPVHTGKRTLDLSAGSVVSVATTLSLHFRILLATCASKKHFKNEKYLNILNTDCVFEF
jgi:hypothetical protein